MRSDRTIARIDAHAFHGGQVEHDLIGSPNALLNGAVIALFPIALGLIGIVAKGLSPRAALNVGASASVLGMGLLVLAVSLPARSTLTGAGVLVLGALVFAARRRIRTHRAR